MRVLVETRGILSGEKMAITRATRLIGLVVAGWLLQPALAAAEDEALVRAKDLYLSASYDEALTILDTLPTGSSADGLEVAEYRVFCLLALNRRAEAQQAIEALVRINRLYKPSEAEASPRIRSVFLEVRQRVLSSIVQSAYLDAKAAFDRQDPRAAALFEHVLDLLTDPDIAASMSDLRTVAMGFRDLSWAAAGTSPSRASGEGGAPPAAPLPPSSSPTPASQSQGGGTRAAGGAAPARPTAGTIARTSSTASIPPVGARTASSSLSSEPEGVVPPEAIFQPMPTWTPASTAESTQTYRGSLELAIDEHGNVMTARMRKPAHPRYDEQLIKAAQTWRFKPASRDGVSIPYLRVVEIELRPYH
ncbi:MAG: hypothetical protein DMF90_03180 [Acidobacteria bacterium]|nr:MAG: hypothetical protein DMF90_03180 [Acidobacteriota bacterium]